MIFVGIPLGAIALVFLAVYAPSWTREGRVRGGTPFEDALWINPPEVGPAQGQSPAAITSGETTEGGGARGTW